MNILLFVLGLNLLTLVNAVNDINFDTILTILQSKPRQTEYTNDEETKSPVEVIPLIPGFDLEKSEVVTTTPANDVQSLFENPQDWPDAPPDYLYRNVVRERKANINTKTKNKKLVKSKRDVNLNQKILKAFRNLNKYRNSQKQKRNKLRKVKKQHKASGKTRKVPIKKMLGRMFRGLKDSSYRLKKANKKPQFRADSEASNTDVKVLSELLKSIIKENQKYNKIPVQKKHAYRYLIEPEEQSQEGGDFLESVLHAVQNNNRDLETEESGLPQQQPDIIIISTGSDQDDDMESENSAQESMEIFDDYGHSNSFNQQTRRSADIGGKKDDDLSVSDSTEDSSDSSYERNPGNPFTVHKNKYKQNWPYNHYMDGDHMNINPFGPQFGVMGPTGPELFFGRKWWYFNQDDFKPMG
ncbi:hypothetical protein PYW08_014304 [Mythimna loreyi]|uniref:Uncharacterized protein n=1 Tax=Mythimna loreyi TaxID=667449 RepID=A0ACC2R9T5_9NEOP|nr:hypothetical protein PYW08_014304 [Mythimna loreyi]